MKQAQIDKLRDSLADLQRFAGIAQGSLDNGDYDKLVIRMTQIQDRAQIVAKDHKKLMSTKDDPTV